MKKRKKAMMSKPKSIKLRIEKIFSNLLDDMYIM